MPRSTTTTNQVIQVQVADTNKKARTFNIDNPKESITTFNQVKAAFKPAIDGGWWVSSDGLPISEVTSVTLTTTQKVKFDNTGVEITVTPAYCAFSNVNPSGEVDLTVTGSPVVGGYFTDLDVGVAVITRMNVYKLSSSVLRVEYAFQNVPTQASGSLHVVTEDGEAVIPVQLTT